MTEQSNFAKLAAIDVSKHIEKKNNLSYLSWAWAVDQLLRADPTANWQYNEPVKFGETMMVSCTVTAFGKAMTMHLPVMDYRNKAIVNPNAFEINTAMMRCLVKAIALHGLGLYIYAGEDLPVDPTDEVNVVSKKSNGKPSSETGYKPEGEELIFIESVYDILISNKANPSYASEYLYEKSHLDVDQITWIWNKLGEEKIMYNGKEYKYRGVLKTLHEQSKQKEAA